MAIWRDRKRNRPGLPWTFTVYSFDEERLYADYGFLNQKHDEVRLYRILDILYSRSLGQRLFGLGSIHINSSDRTLGTFTLKNMKQVKKVNEMLSDLVEIEREKKRVTAREYVDMDDDDPDLML